MAIKSCKIAAENSTGNGPGRGTPSPEDVLTVSPVDTAASSTGLTLRPGSLNISTPFFETSFTVPEIDSIVRMVSNSLEAVKVRMPDLWRQCPRSARQGKDYTCLGYKVFPAGEDVPMANHVFYRMPLESGVSSISSAVLAVVESVRDIIRHNARYGIEAPVWTLQMKPIVEDEEELSASYLISHNKEPQISRAEGH